MKRTSVGLLIVASLGIGCPVTAQQDEQIQAMEWRNLGPMNGGRGTSVVGHPTDPFTFWFGHSSGGLWKTDDAGAYWTPVGQGQFRYASVGAIALHEKNPDIMYVGLGEPQLVDLQRRGMRSRTWILHTRWAS